jgi:MoaA/NifB/PqqE/SkfB family radical SAM enzyme
MVTDQVAVSPVTFLALEITGKCQLRCIHCYAGSGPAGTHGTMTALDWERLIDEAAGMGVRTVQFIGGEPTLHPELSRLVQYAVAAGLRVEVFSNLVHVSPGQWAAFSLPGVSLATSWYTPDPAAHMRITGSGGAHARTRANIAEAIGRGIRVRAAIVDIPGGHADAARAELAELAGLGVAEAGAADRVRRVGRGVGTGVAGEPDVAELCGRCGRGRAAVSPDGDVSPCVLSRWMTAGSVLRQPLAEILRGARMRAFTAAIPAPVAACNPACKPSLGDGGDCAPAEKEACGPDYCKPDLR